MFLINVEEVAAKRLKRELQKEKIQVEILDDTQGKDFWGRLKESKAPLIVGDSHGFARAVKLCRQIYAEKISDSSPLIFLGETGEEVDEHVIMEVGADRYVNKHASSKLILAHVDAIKRRLDIKSSHREIKISNLEVDKMSRIVRINKREISVSFKEYEILWLLSKRFGDAVGREEIVQKVWGPEVYVEKRTVDVHIFNLRAKLKKHKCLLEIKPVRRIGYRLSLQ